MNIPGPISRITAQLLRIQLDAWSPTQRMKIARPGSAPTGSDGVSRHVGGLFISPSKAVAGTARTARSAETKLIALKRKGMKYGASPNRKLAAAQVVAHCDRPPIAAVPR